MAGTASVYGHSESIGGNETGRGVGPLGGVGGEFDVGVEAGSEVRPGGVSPVCVAGAAAGARADGTVANHDAGAAAVDSKNLT